ncbi:MAG: hypothetical protein ACRCZF_22505, partial [Gemmataceae bacterium]
LRQILGTNLKVRGAGKKDFFLQGPLQDNAGHLLAALRGQAILGWQSVQAYGFDVGPADLTAKLDNGTLQFDTVEAKFGTIGKVRATPQIRFQPQGTFLNFEKGRIVDHAMLTPAVCADALGYALPLLAKATETEGSISLDLTENSIPLADPEAATLRGALQLHQVKTGPGPLMTQLGGLFGANFTKITLANEQVVPIRIENRRVFHEKMAVTVNGYTITTSGSVGMNGSMSLVADVPLPDNVLNAALKNNPRIREALTNRRVQVPIGGTVQKPQLDPRAFQQAVRQVMEEITKDTAKTVGKEFLEKGRDKLNQEIEKGLGKFLPLPKPPAKKD